METNEVMENVENIDVIDGVVESIDGKVNPMVVGGAVAIGVAAIGLGKLVLWDKVIKPGTAKVKVKLANAKAKRNVNKNDELEELVFENGKLVVDKDSEEQE